MLKASTIEAATENERGLVDIETLKLTQQNLVDTIQETMRIQPKDVKNVNKMRLNFLKWKKKLKKNCYKLSNNKQLN